MSLLRHIINIYKKLLNKSIGPQLRGPMELFELTHWDVFA